MGGDLPHLARVAVETGQHATTTGHVRSHGSFCYSDARSFILASNADPSLLMCSNDGSTSKWCRAVVTDVQ